MAWSWQWELLLVVEEPEREEVDEFVDQFPERCAAGPDDPSCVRPECEKSLDRAERQQQLLVLQQRSRPMPPVGFLDVAPSASSEQLREWN